MRLNEGRIFFSECIMRAEHWKSDPLTNDSYKESKKVAYILEKNEKTQKYTLDNMKPVCETTEVKHHYTLKKKKKILWKWSGYHC